MLENPAYNGNASLSIQAGKFAASIMGYAGYYDGGRTPSESESWQENYDSETATTAVTPKTRAARVTATSDWT